MKVAIIGTGTMGTSIANMLCQCDKVDQVLFCKGRETSVDGKNKLEKELKARVKKDKMTQQDMDGYLAKVISGSIDVAKEANLVIEAVAEDMSLKRDIFNRLDYICGQDTIFATNTSSLSVKAIGEGINHSIVGLHFFNPVPVMQLVEIVVPEDIPADIVDCVINMVESFDKTPIRVSDSLGFVVNRILIPMINEAIGIYAEGVATAFDIDIAMKNGASHPMGPLALADLIGLDVVLSILEVLTRETGNDKYTPHFLLKKMVSENKLGIKTGEGFYKY